MATRKRTTNDEPKNAHDSVWSALHAAHADFTTINKSGHNPHFNSRYATLQDIMNATRPALTKHGLVMYQSPSIIDGHSVLISRIVHVESGECIEDYMPLNTKQKPQQFGSELTYNRRYMMAAQLWVTDGLDDDGNAAQRAEPSGNGDSTNGTGGNGKTQPRTGKPSGTTGKSTPQTPNTDGLSDDDIKTIQSWNGPVDAKKWSLQIGACDNDSNADNAFKNVVVEQFGGKLNSGNMYAALTAFFIDRCKKLNDRALASINDDVDDFSF